MYCPPIVISLAIWTIKEGVARPIGAGLGDDITHRLWRGFIAGRGVLRPVSRRHETGYGGDAKPP